VNHIELTARIAELSPLRYTPAGVPATNLVLDHESEQLEAGTPRQVRLSIKAVTFGILAEQASRLDLSQAFRFRGFLASARTNKSVVFHIQELNPL
jgi:primosomal replication protein N